jgi:hypothetical protein
MNDDFHMAFSKRPALRSKKEELVQNNEPCGRLENGKALEF